MLTHILFRVLFPVVRTLLQTERDQVKLPVDNGPPFSLTEAHKFVSEKQAVLLAKGVGGVSSLIPPSDQGRQSCVSEICEGSSDLVL